MLKLTLHVRQISQSPVAKPRFRYFCSPATPPSNEKTHTIISLIVQRHPILIPTFHKCEVDYLELQERFEKEREELHKITVQKRYEAQKTNQELSKTQKKKQSKAEKEKEEVRNLEKAAQQRDADLMESANPKKDTGPEDMGVPLPAGIKDIPRITEDDLSDNRKSLYRKLEESLFLVVKNNNKWDFPSVPYDVTLDATSVRKTAERAAATLGNLKTHILGNGPVVFTKHTLSNAEKKSLNADVANQFYFRSLYYKGTPELQNGATEFAWASREQLSEYLEKDVYDKIKYAVSVPPVIMRSLKKDENMYQ